MSNTIFIPPNVTQEPGGATPAQNVWPPEAAPPPPAGITGVAFISPITLNQAAWFIDPVNGKDSNNGATPASAVQTFAEVSRRWGVGNVLAPPGNTTTVTILSSLPATDPLDFNTGLAPDGTLVFEGGPPAESPLPVAAAGPVRARNRATNTPWALPLTSAAGPFVGQRILDVTQSTPTAPAYFFGIKDEGADTLRISEPVTYPGVGNDLDPVANRFTPVASDSYVVQTLVSATPGAMTLAGDTGTVVFQDLSFGAPFALIQSIGIQLFMYGVIGPFGSFVQLSSGFLNNVINCLFRGPIDWIVGSFNLFQAGCLLAHAPPVNFIVDISCTLRFDIDIIFQGLQGGATVLTGTRWLFGTCGIFDSTPGGPGGQNKNGSGVYVTPSADAAVTLTDTDTTNQIWGAGNAGAGITVGSNGTFSYDPSVNPTPLSVTGTLGDFLLAGSNTSFAPQTAAFPLGPFADSWANLFGATFPQHVAYDPIYNAWIAPFH